MQSIDFPPSGQLPKTTVPVYLKYGEVLRITFTDGGEFSYINKHAFTKLLPQGFFGETVDAGDDQYSVLITSPAASSDQTAVLGFIKDDDGKLYKYTLIVNATGHA
jgi:hypothetical protein